MMMSEMERENIMRVVEDHKQKGQFQTAIDILEPYKCIVGKYAKGKVLVSYAQALAQDFTFRFYCNNDLMSVYRSVLQQAHDVLTEVTDMLMTASDDIKQDINKMIWYELGQVDNELCRTKPCEEEPAEEYDENYVEDEQHYERHISSLADELQYWELS